MQVIFESREPWGDALREPAVRRVRLAMRHLKWLAPRAKVQMSEVKGECGGIDKRCQVELAADEAGSVVITSITRDWRSALQSALSRAVQALMRKLGKRRAPDAGQPVLEHTPKETP
jgi:hypothetical protein